MDMHEAELLAKVAADVEAIKASQERTEELVKGFIASMETNPMLGGMMKMFSKFGG